MATPEETKLKAKSEAGLTDVENKSHFSRHVEVVSKGAEVPLE